MVTITVRRSTMVRPAESTPRHRLWLSNLDLVTSPYHMTFIQVYRPNGSTDFFDAARLRDALGQVLVLFYPMAGRLARDGKGRIEIDCDGQGVLLAEADTEATVEDFGDFAPTEELKQLTPQVDHTGGITSYPLLLLQVTYFKCGSVSLGFAMKDLVADGLAISHFFNSWSDTCRGAVIVHPFIDRTVLRARNPPTPRFPHVEYKKPPSMDRPSVSPVLKSSTSCVNIFELTPEQLILLKKSCPPSPAFSTYVALAAHVWRCVCIARELPANQLSKLYVATNGRRRLRPPLPERYFGNVTFAASPFAATGELTAADGFSKAAARIHAALARMDDEYLRSALDYLEVQPNLDALVLAPHHYRCPNFRFTSWMGFPVHDADFGWGRPVHTVPGWMPLESDEGLGYVFPSPTRDGSVSLAMCLQPEHMMRFQELIYHISPLGNSAHLSKL